MNGRVVAFFCGGSFACGARLGRLREDVWASEETCEYEKGRKEKARNARLRKGRTEKARSMRPRKGV